ncbi:MAG: hypothetical protein RL641_66 [Candidatus Parcubacteria bacterium]|jgi:UPF0755 protein
MPLIGPLGISSEWQPSLKKRLLHFFLILVGIFIAAIIALYFLATPPKDFPSGKLLEIPEGTSVIKTGKMLEEMHIVRSAVLFQTLVIIFSGDKGVRSGYYIFDSPQSVVTIADKLSFGRYGISRVKVTIPEGFNSMEIADIFSKALPRLDKATFQELAKQNEGYLFPETYYFFETATPGEIIETLRNEFATRLEPHLEDIAKSGHTEREILTMASIIEKESNGRNDREMISGILWNRIEKGMRLEVDATYLYTLEDRDNNKLTTKGIKSDPSPYNTYKNDGLPPGPIGNPGLGSIKAALNPTKSANLFYIHGRDGTAYYAKTYSQHLANIRAHLK